MMILSIFDISNFVYVDESGLNREYRRIYARAKRGVKIHGKKPGKRQKRTNIVAGLLYGPAEKKHIAVHSYDHSTNAEFFEDWFEWQLLAQTPENSIIIMDNASFHRKAKLTKIAARYGIVVLFLPPYSPQLNPIEHSWANLKTWLKYNGNRFNVFEIAIDYYFNEYHY
jgi:transposase